MSLEVHGSVTYRASYFNWWYLIIPMKADFIKWCYCCKISWKILSLYTKFQNVDYFCTCLNYNDRCYFQPPFYSKQLLKAEPIVKHTYDGPLCWLLAEKLYSLVAFLGNMSFHPRDIYVILLPLSSWQLLDIWSLRPTKG